MRFSIFSFVRYAVYLNEDWKNKMETNMKKKYEAFLVSRISRFKQDMDRVAKDREGETLDLKPTTIHLDFFADDSNGLPIGLHISVDPRRLQCGEDGYGGDGTFLVRSSLSPKGFATLISELVAFAGEIGMEGDGVDYVHIDIDEECK
jgi:hypothetical protein